MSNVENRRIGDLLQKARKVKGLSQDEIAKQVGLTKNHISCIERGLNKASIDALLGYCRVLDCTPNDILGYSPMDMELVGIVENMDKKTLRKYTEIGKILINR